MIKKLNIMIGPAPEAKGGMSSVIAQYRNNGFFERLNIVFLPTHIPGSSLKKASATSLSLLKMLQLLLLGKINLVHIHTASYRSFYRKSVFAWLAFLFRRPVIFHIHGGKFIDFFLSSPLHKQRFLKHTLGSADCIIALSNDAAQELRNTLGFGRDKIEVIANPISLSYHAKTSIGSTQRILFLGDIKKEKGIYDLVDAVALLKNTYPAIELFCGGLGEVNEVKAYAALKGVHDNVHMLGWVHSEQKKKEFQQADLFVLPSFAEVQPMTILEAMAAGTPVIASNVGGIPEMLQDGALGSLISPGEPTQLGRAIAHALSAQTESLHKANLATEVIKTRYAPHVICEQLAGIYRAHS